MLDDAAASAGTTGLPVGREFYGRARDIRRQITAEDLVYDATVDALMAPVGDRLRRFPKRSLRPEMLAGLIQSWRFMDCRDWLLDLSARLDKARASLTEHRLVAGVMRRAGDPNWTGIEDDLAAVHVQLDVDRNRVHLESRCVATFSLHAIARRLERHPDGSLAALMFDINLAVVAASGELVPGAGYKLPTHEDGGGWRGRVIRQTGPDGETRPVLAVRTWIDDG